MYRTLNSLSARLLHAGLLATLVAIAAAAAPRPAEAALLCKRGNGCVDWSTVENCEAFVAFWTWAHDQTDSGLYACFMLSTNPGTGSGGAGPHLLRHANGELSLAAEGRRSSIVIASAAGEKQLADFLAKVRQFREPGQPAAREGIDLKAEFHKTFDAVYAGGSRRVTDARLQQISRELRLPIVTEKPRG